MSDPVRTTTALDTFALGDDAFAEAYESVGAQKRAQLKHCIAVLYESFGESPAWERRERLFRQGFTFIEQDDGPARGVSVLCPASYPHPEGLLAALMPALVAGARPDLFFIHSPSENSLCSLADATCQAALSPLPHLRHYAVEPLLLAALELAGVEEAWLLGEDAILEYIQRDAPVSGRLLLLGEAPYGEKLVLEAHRRGILFRSLCGPAANVAAGTAVGTHLSHNAGTTATQESRALHFWPHLDPGWFRQRSSLAITP